MMGYNICFTFLPIAVFGVIDETLDHSTIFKFPSLYKWGQDGLSFTWDKFLFWMINGIIHSTIIYFGHTVSFVRYLT